MASKVRVLPPTPPSQVVHPPLKTSSNMFMKSQRATAVPATHFLTSKNSIFREYPSGSNSKPLSTIRAAELSSDTVSDGTGTGNATKDTSAVKAHLYQALQGINRGIFGITSEKKMEIEGLIKLLESQNPTADPTGDLDKLVGNWKLVYSTITILGSKRTKLGLRDFISLGDFYQTIDVTKGKAINLIKFNVRGLNLLNGQLEIVASYKIASPSRVSISYENSIIIPDQLMSVFEKNYHILLGIFNPEGWLEITYVDDELRVGRDDKGNIFVLERPQQDIHEPFGADFHEVQRFNTSDARLVLQDGSIWRAKSFGAKGTQVGEVVFNTSLTGYQEILTDPSYAGQFVLMTNPHIGNTGVNFGDEELSECFLGGLVIRSLSIGTSNWRCVETLCDYLTKRNIMGIYDVDTHAITRRLRQDGSLIGVLSTEESRTDEDLLQMSRSCDIVGVDLISGVSCTSPYECVDKTDLEWDFNINKRYRKIFKVVAYDFGIKHNILRRLASLGCKITVVPATWSASETLKTNPDGVLFCNGPGDPSAVPYAVKTVKELLGKVPEFGLCMGHHQLLGQALGGKTFKMKFGHHGGNHPVRDICSDRVDISAQNHNYAFDPGTLPEGVEVTHINL